MVWCEVHKKDYAKVGHFIVAFLRETGKNRKGHKFDDAHLDEKDSQNFLASINY